jgi:hypothetical protein
MPPQVPHAQRIEDAREKAHLCPPSERGHWVRTAGILSPLVIAEVVPDAERRLRFIGISSVAAALISEGIHVHRLRLEREHLRGR